MTNGYIVLTKGDAKLYQHAVEAINLGKPIYFVDAENKTIYFGNKIALEDSNVVINAGNDTITIDASNNVTVTTSGGGGAAYIHTLYCLANFGCTDAVATFTLTSNDATPLTIGDIAALVEADHTLIIHTIFISNIELNSEAPIEDIKYDSSNEYVMWGDRAISGEEPDITWFYDLVSLSM